jgi:Tfp pilus assembly protein PilF
LKAAVALDPDHYDVRYHLGVAFFHLQQNSEAVEQLKRAVVLDPNQADAHFHLAQVLRATGQTAEAQEQLKIYQERKQATNNLALSQTKAGQAAQALNSGNAGLAAELYREAIEAQPRDALLQYDLALALETRGDSAGEGFARERAALEKAIELKPAFAAAENQLGFVLARAGENEAAEKHFRNALATAPRFAEAANNLGTLLGQEGRDTEAEVRFRSAVSANPRYVRAWVNLAATLASESHFAEAKKAIESALKVDPNDQDALHLQKMLASAPAASAEAGAPAPIGRPSSSQVPR